MGGGSVQNMKFTPRMMHEDKEKVKILFDTYFKKGGCQLMITCVDHGVLEDAQKHPENYPDLIVRVAGYSAVFVNLTPDIPYFNNVEKTLQSIIDLAFELNITNINLLPYHTLGKNKWGQINKQYYLENEKMLEKETLKKYIQYGNDRGINIKIGG